MPTNDTNYSCHIKVVELVYKYTEHVLENFSANLSICLTLNPETRKFL